MSVFYFGRVGIPSYLWSCSIESAGHSGGREAGTEMR